MRGGSNVKFAHGLQSDGTTEDMYDYTEYCLTNYKEMEWKSDSLLAYFCDEFKDVTVKDFKGLEKNLRR